MPKYEVVMSRYKTVVVTANTSIQAIDKAEEKCNKASNVWFADYATEVENGK